MRVVCRPSVAASTYPKPNRSRLGFLLPGTPGVSVLEELNRINPKINAKGTRRDRFYQRLSGYGIEKLKRQVQSVEILVSVPDNGDESRIRSLRSLAAPFGHLGRGFPARRGDTRLSRLTQERAAPPTPVSSAPGSNPRCRSRACGQRSSRGPQPRSGVCRR